MWYMYVNPATCHLHITSGRFAILLKKIFTSLLFSMNSYGEWLTGRQGQEGLAKAVVKVGCQVGPVVQ